LKKKIKNIFFSLKILVSTGLLLYIILKFSPSFISATSALFNPYLLIAVLGNSLILIQILAVLRWNIFLKAASMNIPLYRLLKINLKAIFWGLILPSADGFALIRIYYLEKEHSAKKGIASGTVILEKVTGAICLCSLALIFSFFAKNISYLVKIRIIITILLILTIGFFLLITRIKLGEKILKKKIFLSKMGKNIAQYLDNLNRILNNRNFVKATLKALPLILLVQLFCILNVHLLFIILGTELNLINNLVLVPIIQILSLIPISISGFGVREGLFSYLYQTLGVDISISFTVSILNFIFLTGFPATTGGILYIIAKLKKNS